jgi:hypothetical protein
MGRDIGTWMNLVRIVEYNIVARKMCNIKKNLKNSLNYYSFVIQIVLVDLGYRQKLPRSRGAQIFQKLGHLQQILGARRVT